MKPKKTASKNKSMGLMSRPHKKAVFNMTPKLRLRDSIKWHPENKTIDYLIRNEPIQLWHRIYNQKNNETRINLVSTAYAKLKDRIQKLEPSLIEDLNNKKKRNRDFKTLKRKINNGINPVQVGRFKKLASRKVMD